MAKHAHTGGGADAPGPIGPGSVLSERYIVTRKLGEGGMGVVFEAIDRERRMPVALKLLPSSDAAWMAQFKTEFRALVDVVHPNLVSMYELVACGDELYFTMEVVEGVHFLRYVRPRHDGATSGTHAAVSATRETAPSGPMPGDSETALPTAMSSMPWKKVTSAVDLGVLDPDRLRASVRQLAVAVAAIHDAGMLHRDLKPTNVLVTSSGRLVVLDFGLVTLVGADYAQPLDHRRVGTVAYMAPEQGARRPLSEASDWYAVGVMLYQALTGRLPFAGGYEDVLLDKQQRDPPPPRAIAPDAPADLDQLCVELLRRDPLARPAGAEVLRRLGNAPPRIACGGGPSARSALVGREAQRRALQRAFDDARGGRAVAAFVRGGSGMGKTALVRSFLDAVGKDAIVLRGRCYERESVPFKAVDSVIDALAAYLSELTEEDQQELLPAHGTALVRLFPALGQIAALCEDRGPTPETSDLHVLRRIAFRALRELLCRVSRDRPVILAVDDLQWGDLDSAELLACVFEPPDPPSLLVLGCCRSDDMGDESFLEVFGDHMQSLRADIRHVEVGPLRPEHARALARQHVDARVDLDEQVERIVQESAGSPFFVEELARYLLATGKTAGTLRLEEALRARIEQLPGAARRLLSTIAVAGRPIPQSLALRAAGSDDPAALLQLTAGTFVRTGSAGGSRQVEAYHDRVRETVVSMLADAERRGRHLDLARAIEAAPDPDPEALAIHYHGGGLEERAAAFAEVAARRRAESLAFDQAARLYRMALALRDDESTALRLQTELGHVLSSAGRSAEAAAAYLAAVDAGAEPSRAVELERRAAEELLRGGHIREGLELVDKLLDAIDVRVPDTPKRAITSLLASRVQLALRGLELAERPASATPERRLRQIDTTFAVATALGPIDAIRAAALSTKHLLMALDAGEPFRVLQGLASEACFVSVKGVRQRDRTARILARLEALSTRIGTPPARAILHGARGISHFQFGDWQSAFEHCRSARELFRDDCTGYGWEEATATVFESYALAFLGRLPELHALVDDSLRRAEERGDRYLDTSLRVAVRFYRHAENDDPGAAIAEIDRALETWSSGRFDSLVWIALLAYFNIDSYAGAPERGIERHRAYWPLLQRSHLWTSQVLRSHHEAFLARLYLRAGTRARNADHLARAARFARRLGKVGAKYTDGFAALLRAGLSARAGDMATAIELLAAAEEVFVATGMRLNEAACKVRRGQLAGGDEGARLVAEGTRFLGEIGLRNVAAVVPAVCPGFGDD